MSAWAAIEARTADEHDRFVSALAEPALAQERVLGEILARNAGCGLGRRFGFSAIRDADAYRARVPIHRYRDLARCIEASVDQPGTGAFSEPVSICEETSASTGPGKLIPYTAASLRAFRCALYPWLHDLARNRPGLRPGRAYFALSPATRARRRTRSGVPIGMDDDTAYFGQDLAGSLADLIAVPGSLASLTDVDDWRYLTLRCLADADDLTLISVWSPTFLSTLLDALPRLVERLAGDIARGTATAPSGFDPGWRFDPRPGRARRIVDALANPRRIARELWPALDLVSCWTDGTAARFVPDLRERLPGVSIQGKGLLATEGVVSVPLDGSAHPVLALNSAFFEFIDDREESRLAHEIEVGRDYRVLLTTHGGLYRYDIADRVRVKGHAAATPTLEFLGRDGYVSDLCGEKITEVQVGQILAGFDGFALLAPCTRRGPRYVVVVDAAQRDAAAARALGQAVDLGLRGNPHYDHARRIGQLGPVAAERREGARERYLRWLEARGQRIGEVKPPVLYRGTDWESILEDA